MSASRAEFSYASALNRNELFGTPALSRDIPRLLDPEENVLLALPGVAGEYPDVLVVTDRRVVLAKVSGPIRRARIRREAPASAVTGVSFGGGSFHRVRIEVSGQRRIAMMPHRKKDAARFTEELEHLLRTGSLPG